MSGGLDGDIESSTSAPPPMEASSQPFAVGNPMRTPPPVAPAASPSPVSPGVGGGGGLTPEALARIAAARQAAAQQLALVSGTDGSDTSAFLSNPLHDKQPATPPLGPSARPSVALPPVAPGLRHTASKRFNSSGDLQHEPRHSSPLAVSARRALGAPRSSSMHVTSEHGDSKLPAADKMTVMTVGEGSDVLSDEFLPWVHSPLVRRNRTTSKRLESDALSLGPAAEEDDSSPA